jgi:hypothetical protein
MSTRRRWSRGNFLLAGVLKFDFKGEIRFARVCSGYGFERPGIFCGISAIDFPIDSK